MHSFLWAIVVLHFISFSRPYVRNNGRFWKIIHLEYNARTSHVCLADVASNDIQPISWSKDYFHILRQLDISKYVTDNPFVKQGISVDSLRLCDACICRWTESSTAQVIKPVAYWKSSFYPNNYRKFEWKGKHFPSRKCIWIFRLQMLNIPFRYECIECHIYMTTAHYHVQRNVLQIKRLITNGPRISCYYGLYHYQLQSVCETRG